MCHKALKKLDTFPFFSLHFRRLKPNMKTKTRHTKTLGENSIIVISNIVRRRDKQEKYCKKKKMKNRNAGQNEYKS